jgi:tetratricopeptide (TPR) repeat protein/tRNA A-37 threonylcarbamoyl transferase component Bud32
MSDAGSAVPPERRNEVKRLFAAVLDTPAEKRAAMLEALRATDPAVAAEVASLVAWHESAPNFLGAGTARERLLALGGDELLGRRVDVYRIVELIGSGGMGDVYKAVRDDDQYRVEVAIKIMRADLQLPFGERRFRTERQILAQLDHRNIARIIDGGTLEQGLPYVVMELVSGVPIDRYCDERGLDVRERIRLFLQVCDAVSFAHRHLVVHRDLKPSNILVTPDGGVKLLDFGIAKLLQPDDAPATQEETRTQMRAMTLEYASPEQVSGANVTTVSDVYSLGVVLYRLLTGASPYRAFTNDAQRVAEIISESIPEVPSAAARKIGALRLDADIDAVLLTALRKEPERRYGSVVQFADDLRAICAGLPVAARGPALRYRLGKFARRHRMELAAGAVVLLALVTGLAVSVHSTRVAERERAIAQRNFEHVRGLANAVMFELDNSLRGVAGATPARKLAVQRAQEYLELIARGAATDPSLLRELAVGYAKLAAIQGEPRTSNLGDFAGALANYRKAAEFIDAAARLAPEDAATTREIVNIYCKLSSATAQMNLRDEPHASLAKALDVANGFLAAHPGDLEMRHALARVYEQRAGFARGERKYDEAIADFQRAHAIYEDWLAAAPDDISRQQELAFSHKHIGAILIVQQKYKAALAHYDAARVTEEAQLAADPGNADKRFNITYTYNDTGYIRGSEGDVDGALEYYTRSYRIRRELSEADPENVRYRSGLAYVMSLMGLNQRRKKQYDAALNSQLEALGQWETLAMQFFKARVSPEVAGIQEEIGRTHLEMAKAASASRGAAFRANCAQAARWFEKSLATRGEVAKRRNTEVNEQDPPSRDTLQEIQKECRG